MTSMIRELWEKIKEKKRFHTKTLVMTSSILLERYWLDESNDTKEGSQ